MLLSLSTFCLYPLPLRATFRLAAELGFQGVELVASPGARRTDSRALASLAHEYSLGIFSLHQELVSPGPWRGFSRRIGNALDMALELGCPRVVIHGPGAASWESPQAQDWLRAVEAGRERTLGAGTRLSLENPPFDPQEERGAILRGLPEILDFVRQHDLDVTFDTCHAGIAGMQLLQAYSLTRGHVTNVHLSDFCHGRLFENIRHLRSAFAHHQIPGDGCLPLTDLISQMASDGYQHPVTVEVSPIALQSWSPRQRRVRLARTAQYVRSAADAQRG